MGWAWYLYTDFVLFSISIPGIVIFHRKYGKKAGIRLTKVLIGAGITFIWSYTYSNDILLSHDHGAPFMDHVYTRFYFRSFVYHIGGLVMQIHTNENGAQQSDMNVSDGDLQNADYRFKN